MLSGRLPRSNKKRAERGTVMSVLVDVDEFRCLGGAARDTALMGVEREIRRLQAMQAELITVVAESRSFRDDGHRSLRAWVQAVTNSSRSTAVGVVQRAAMLADLPAVATAFAAGRLGCDQVAMLTRLHANRRCREHLGAVETVLVSSAAGFTWGDFGRVCGRV